ncbi:MAG: Ldh family oxidoreductase, partial [Hylemonella sp.]
EGQLLPGEWVMDGHGNPSRDPGVLFAEPKGTILPLGGLDVGHKGYGLTMMVEALTGGLAGFGRADPRQGWGATVFLQILDPRAFAGLEAFKRQTSAVAVACHASRPRNPEQPVRTPGERGLLLADSQKVEGVSLHESIMPALAPWAGKLGVPAPSAF